MQILQQEFHKNSRNPWSINKLNSRNNSVNKIEGLIKLVHKLKHYRLNFKHSWVIR